MKRRTEKDFSVVNIRDPYRTMLEQMCAVSMRSLTAELHFLINKAHAEINSGANTEKSKE